MMIDDSFGENENSKQKESCLELEKVKSKPPARDGKKPVCSEIDADEDSQEEEDSGKEKPVTR